MTLGIRSGVVFFTQFAAGLLQERGAASILIGSGEYSFEKVKRVDRREQPDSIARSTGNESQMCDMRDDLDGGHAVSKQVKDGECTFECSSSLRCLSRADGHHTDATHGPRNTAMVSTCLKSYKCL